MWRRIIRNTSQAKSGLDFFLLPIIRLFHKNEAQISNVSKQAISMNPAGEGEKDSQPPFPRPDNYIEQVLKYIPSEIVAAYLFAEGILKSIDRAAEAASWIVFAFLLLVTPFYIWATTTEKPDKEETARKAAAWDQIIISFLSFGVWVFAIGGPFAFLSWYNPVYGSVLLVLFTFLPPIITKIICRTFSLASCQSSDGVGLQSDSQK